MPKPTTHKRSVCPVACALDLIGDRWTLLVLRDLFVGKTHYREFLASPEGIATNILADRLHKLVEHGLARATSSDQREGANAYELTPRGKSLLPVVRAIRDWGLANIPGTKALVGGKTKKAS